MRMFLKLWISLAVLLCVSGAETEKLEVTTDGFVELNGSWNDYFGVHFETARGPWKMVRQYDGPEFGMPPRDRHTGDVKTLDGPFASAPVQMALADFRDWKRKDASGLDENLARLTSHERSALFIVPWANPFTLAQQDQVWAMMKLLYGASLNAENRIFFQWGDDINYRHLGRATNARVLSAAPRGGAKALRDANLPEDAAAYVENYLAPAVEAVRRASQEIYNDPRRIPVVAGSCALSSRPEFRAWLGQMLDHEITGVESLKGQRAVQVVDYLAVNYPFADATSDAALQEIWDRFGKEVKGLWVTEQYGASRRGLNEVIAHSGLFLQWAARNRLTAQQTRLMWNFPSRTAQDLLGFMHTIGEAMGDAPLRICGKDKETYCITAGDARFLVLRAEATPRKGRKPSLLREITIPLSDTQAKQEWSARLFQQKSPKAPPEIIKLKSQINGRDLQLSSEQELEYAWALLIETSK
jgi:hypothetical protein